MQRPLLKKIIKKKRKKFNNVDNFCCKYEEKKPEHLFEYSFRQHFVLYCIDLLINNFFYYNCRQIVGVEMSVNIKHFSNGN